MKKLWVISSIALVVGIIYGVTATRNSQDSSKLATIKKGNIVERVTVNGQVQPHKKTIIAPPYKGYVQKIFVKIGDQVKKNDPIVTISQTSQPDAGAYPLRAPFDGIVVQVFRTEGEYVEEAKDNNPLVRIDNVDRFFVLANIPELEILKVKKNQAVEIKLSALPDKTYHGVVTEVALSNNEKKPGWYDDTKIEYQARINVVDPDSKIKPGLTGVLDIQVHKTAETWILPLEYLYKSHDKYLVLLESGEKRTVKVGAYNEEAAEILEGLKPTEKVQLIDFAKMEAQLRSL